MGWGRLGRHLVVLELDVLPGDPLLDVQLLLRLKHAREEELLQLLVGEVDAELLEGVVLEVLKAEDVEQTDIRQLGRLLAAGKVAVNLGDDPVEQMGIDRLRARDANVRPSAMGSARGTGWNPIDAP